MLHTHMVVSLKFPDLYFHLSPRHKYMTLGFLNVCTYVQAICDARRRFVFVSMDMPGATHDSRAFSFSALWAALQIGLLISGYYILEDAAYQRYMPNFHTYIRACQLKNHFFLSTTVVSISVSSVVSESWWVGGEFSGNPSAYRYIGRQ